MILIATLMYGLSAPGQTASISVFLDPIIRDINVDRTTITWAYLAGTLVGALALPYIGRLVDRFGVRKSTALIGFVLSLSLVVLAIASNIWGLVIGFIGIRMLGQGALTLAASALISRWFDKRRGFVMGIQAAFGAGLISLFPVILERLIATTGDWRQAMLLEAAIVAVIVIPMSLIWIRNRPADVGQFVDGDPDKAEQSRNETGATRAQAMRTPFYWVLVASVSMVAFFATAIGFHQIAILGERGLSATEAASNFIPQMIAGTIATLLVGYLVDRRGPRLLIASSMFLLALGIVMIPFIDPGWSAIGFGLIFGAGANTAKSIEAGMTPRYFGTANIGAIRGVMASILIGGSSVAPLLYSLFFDWTGSFTSVLLASAIVPLFVLVAAIVVPLPPKYGATNEV